MQLSGGTSFVVAGHTDPLWKLAAAAGKHRRVEAGTMLFEQGEAARYVYFVLAGRLDVYRKDGRWRVVWSRVAGDVLSFDCAGCRELNCKAAEPTELIAVERRKLVDMARGDDAIAARLEEFNAGELRIVLSTLGDASRMQGADVIEIVFGTTRPTDTRQPSRRGRRPPPQRHTEKEAGAAGR